MGTSFVTYRGEGFWAKDIHLIELAQSIKKSGIPSWFPENISEYYIGLSEDQVGVGCITLWLDELLENNQKLEWFEVAIEKAEFQTLNEEGFKACLLKLLKGEFTGKPSSGFYYWQNTKNA